MTRAEYVQWCKDRALEYARAGDRAGAIASMLSDIRKWEHGPLYANDLITVMFQDAMFFRNTPEDIINWIEGFN